MRLVDLVTDYEFSKTLKNEGFEGKQVF